MVYNNKLFHFLKNKDLVVVFFHSVKKPVVFKSYKVPKVNYLPFPASSGNLLYTFCLRTEILPFLEQWPKTCNLVSLWSGKELTWVRPSDYFLLSTSSVYSNPSKFFKIYYNLLFTK